MVDNQKLFQVEFGKPDGYNGGWITMSNTPNKVFVMAETYAKAVGKALKWAEENRKSLVDGDGSLKNEEEQFQINKVVLVADKIVI